MLEVYFGVNKRYKNTYPDNLVVLNYFKQEEDVLKWSVM